MMACCADEIIAAPFSFIGSIGVIAEMPNIHKVLTKNDVDWNMFTAGKFKRTITLFSENTPEGKEKFQNEIEAIHDAFKQHVHGNRGDVLDIEQVATGEAWLALQCKDYGLVDQLGTSSDVMNEYANKGYDIIRLSRQEPKKDPLREFFQRSIQFCEEAVDVVSQKVWSKVSDPMEDSDVERHAGVRGDGITRMSPQGVASRASFKEM